MNPRKNPALVVALVALVAAMGGSAAALPGSGNVDRNDVKKNAIRSKAIKNGQVKRVDIAQGAVTGDQIADGAVDGSDIADGAVGTADIAGRQRPPVRPRTDRAVPPGGRAGRAAVLRRRRGRLRVDQRP